MTTPDLIAFMSYVHVQDEIEQNKIETVRHRLVTEVELQTGASFQLFYDRRDVQWGEAWQRRIETAIDNAAYLIPIITPKYFSSEYCRAEFGRFLDREHLLGRDDLILPIYYVWSPQLEDQGAYATDEVANALAQRQYADFRTLRFSDFESEQVHETIGQLAGRIARSYEDGRRAQRSLHRRAMTSARRAKDASTAPKEFLNTDDIGVATIFPSWEVCQEELLRHLTESKYIRVFVQIGKSVLSGAAVIYNSLERARPDAEVRILHSAPDSPYLGERIALSRGSDYAEWRDDIEYAGRVAERLQSRLGSLLQIRQHSEGYIWRIFILDDVAYMQPYLYPRENSRLAPVIKFSRVSDMASGTPNPNSMYNLVSNYFDFKWDECGGSPALLVDYISEGEPSSVVGFVRHHDRYVFAIPKRFLDVAGDSIAFHGIGGKREEGENWTATLLREAKEEIGVSIEIKSSAYTRELTTNAEFGRRQLGDNPRPYCVYKRTRNLDPDVLQSELRWIVGYEAEIPDDASPTPQREVAALVHLSPAMLVRAARTVVTYEDIRLAGDGSQIVVQDGVEFDYAKRAVPTGLATIQVLRWR